MTPLTPRRPIYAMFFLSGACGLVYQIIWMRMMTLVFGVTVYAASAVLTAFMIGLTLGSFYFGRRADRSPRPLVLYGGLEIGIGLFSLLLPFLLGAIEPLFIQIYRALSEGHYHLFSFIRFLLVFPLLLAPTFLMGGTFPLIARQFVRAELSLGRDVGYLYAINTAGAVIGSFAVGFLMLAYVGLWGSTLITAGLNVAVGLCAIALGRRGSEEPRAKQAPEEEPRAKQTEQAQENADVLGSSAAPFPSPRRGAALALAAIGLSGFASLSLEVLWTRVLVFHTHNSTYAFSSMLIVFLSGIALGGWLYGLLAPRIRREWTLFAALEMGIAVWSVFSLWFVGQTPRITEVMANALPFNNWFEVIALILTQTFMILLVPATLMGATFPLATRLVARGAGGAGGLGRRVGDVYGVNTIGAALGSFAAGFVLIPLFGVRTSFIVVAGVNAAIAAALLLGSGELCKTRSRVGAALAVVFIVAAQVIMPADAIQNDFSKTLGDLVYFNEEVTDTIMVVDLKDHNGVPNKAWRMLVFADGRGTAGHPTVAEDRFYGHLPMLLSRNPESVLNICVGAGNTIGAMLTHSRLKHLDCVELSPGVKESLKYFETNNGVYDKQKTDSRLRIIIEDGRNYLLATDKKYDIVHLDPPELHTAGVVFLYTREFYELAKARLKPGGIFSHWFNATKLTEDELKSVVGTFLSVFPNGTIWQGPNGYSWNLIASNEPLRIPLADAERVIASEPEVKANLAEVGLDDPLKFFSYLTMSPESVGKFASGAPILTDDRTRIDFTSPRSPYSGFGFMHVFSSAHVARGLMGEGVKPPDGSAGHPKPAPNANAHRLLGGWETIARLGAASDDPRALVDWTGENETKAAAAREGMGKFIEARRADMQTEYRKYAPPGQ